MASKGCGKSGKTPPPTVRGRRAGADQRAVRRSRVAELMLLELSHDEVAAELAKEGMGCNRSTVTRDMGAIRQEWRVERVDTVQEWIDRELRKLRSDEARLRRILRNLAPQDGITQQGDVEPPQPLSADTYAKVYDRVLKIMVRRARMLGLDEPTRVQAQVDAALDATAGVAVELVDHASLRALSPTRRREAVEAARVAIAGVFAAAPT